MANSVSLHLANKFVEQIKKRLPLEQYIEEDCGLKLYKIGQNRYRRSCPFHSERQPSFMVYTDTQSYWCFGCKTSGNIVKFAQQFNGWSWQQTIDHFSDRFGISHDITDAEIAELVFENYIKRCCGRIDNLNAIGVNYFISRECKKISRNFPDFPKIQKWIENVYEVADKIISDEDRTSLHRLRYQVFPLLQDYVENIKEKKEKLHNLFVENKLCYACSFRYSSNKVVTGNGNILAPVMFIVLSPENDEEEAFSGIRGKNIKDTIKDLGYEPNDFWYDYVLNCMINRMPDKESKICKSKWLNKRIEIIQPKALVVIGEAGLYIGKQNNFKEYFKLDEIEVHCFKEISKDRLEDILNKHAK